MRRHIAAALAPTPKTFRRLYRRGHTRSHLELGSQALRSRWYCMGNLCGRVGRRQANFSHKASPSGSDDGSQVQSWGPFLFCAFCLRRLSSHAMPAHREVALRRLVRRLACDEGVQAPCGGVHCEVRLPIEQRGGSAFGVASGFEPIRAAGPFGEAREQRPRER